jgi:hypothetical protein
MRLNQDGKLIVVDMSIASNSPPHHADTCCAIVRSHAELYMFTESMNAWIFVSTFQRYSGWALSDFTFTPNALMRVRELGFKWMNLSDEHSNRNQM